MGFYIALVFLTRIPLPQINFDKGEISSSVPYFPLAGGVIGGLLWGVFTCGQRIFPPIVLAGILVLADTAITGGMHLDAVADTMDGLFCFGDQEKKLSVMRDSRIGAFGVVGIVLFILLKYVLFLSLLDLNAPWSILVYPVLSRWVVTYSLSFSPYPRKEGLAKAFTTTKARGNFVLSTIIAIILTWLFGRTKALFGLVGAAVGGLVTISYFTRQFGGMTGDTHGATIGGAEIFILMAFVIQSYLRRG